MIALYDGSQADWIDWIDFEKISGDDVKQVRDLSVQKIGQKVLNSPCLRHL